MAAELRVLVALHIYGIRELSECEQNIHLVTREDNLRITRVYPGASMQQTEYVILCQKTEVTRSKALNLRE